VIDFGQRGGSGIGCFGVLPQVTLSYVLFAGLQESEEKYVTRRTGILPRAPTLKLAVNRLVAGSNPARGANKFNNIRSPFPRHDSLWVRRGYGCDDALSRRDYCSQLARADDALHINVRETRRSTSERESAAQQFRLGDFPDTVNGRSAERGCAAATKSQTPPDIQLPHTVNVLNPTTI
jgi:hypothetical protein